MSINPFPIEGQVPEMQSSHVYEPPCIEQVLQPEDLEREVAYAGLMGSAPT